MEFFAVSYSAAASSSFSLAPPPPPLAPTPTPFVRFVIRIRGPYDNRRRVSAISKTLEESPSSSSSSSYSSLSSTPTSASIAKSFNSPARRSAIAEVEASNDLDAALSRVEGILRIQDYNIILRYFGEAKRWSEMSRLFEWMQKHKKLDFVSYSSYFKYIGISCNPAKALQVYESIPDKLLKVKVSVCNSFLGCMLRNGRCESGLKLFEQMKDDGLSPDLVTYSTLIAGCTKLKNGYSKAMALVQEMKSKGLHMDSVTYGALLSICAANNLTEEAEKYFQQMKDEGCHPNLFHYSSLLNAYAVDRNHVKAEKLVNDMKSSGVAPNKVILTTLLKVYARGSLFEKSRDLLAELEALGYAEDEVHQQ